MSTTNIIPCYPYVQFLDDENIDAWFSAHNSYCQKYLDWFLNTPLAIYTNSTVNGPLLDWVANGVYGVYRTPIASISSKSKGAINTYTPDELPLNQGVSISTSSVTSMTDEVLKSLITWNFYKGDGAQFTIPWIKKRVARFIYGIDGFTNTNNISVKFTGLRTISIQVIATKAESTLTQQLYSLLLAGIPNFPYGYEISMKWIDTYIINNDFGGDIT